MEYSQLQQKGFEIAKRYENLPLQERLNIIARTFGCETASIGSSLCFGKYRGYSDIHIAFDNGVLLPCTMVRTPQAKTVKVKNEVVNDTLARYHPEIVREIKERAAAALSKREAEDNAIAKEKGLKPYRFLNVELNNGAETASGGYIGWYFVTLAIEDKIIGHLETGLCHDIARGAVSENISKQNYYSAGALRDSEVDFVFNNVGFSSSSKSYQVPLNADMRERAEQRLREISLPPAAPDETAVKMFEVTITETLRMKVFVEATDQCEAEQTVSDSWSNGDYILDAECFVGADFAAAPITPDMECDYESPVCENEDENDMEI